MYPELPLHLVVRANVSAPDTYLTTNHRNLPAGWRFNGSGSAAAIPQARFDGEPVERRAIASKRACVATYPTQARALRRACRKLRGCTR